MKQSQNANSMDNNYYGYQFVRLNQLNTLCPFEYMQWRRQPKNGGPNNLSLLVSSKSYNIPTWDPLYNVYIKMLSMDLRLSQDGFEHKWKVRTQISPWRRYWIYVWITSVFPDSRVKSSEAEKSGEYYGELIDWIKEKNYSKLFKVD